MKILSLLFLSFLVSSFLPGKKEDGSLNKYFKNSETPKTFTMLPEDSNKLKEKAVIPGDFADPSVIRNSDIYYAAGTSSEWAPHFPLFQSTDLLHWQPIGFVFNQTPSW